MPIRVLLVDDEPDMRMLVRLMLERTDDIEVVGEAATGEEALTRVAQLSPDLLLLDQMMPGLTGIETARRLLGDSSIKAPRIVMFSAFSDVKLKDEALQVGIDRCLSKDDFADVADAIREVGS
jgi:CheY-like chemotaxis protein